MKDHRKILIELKMLDEGIVPNTDYTANVEHQLSLMPSDQARKAKRKFRKLKRRALKKSAFIKPNPAQEKFAVIMMLAKDIDT